MLGARVAGTEKKQARHVVWAGLALAAWSVCLLDTTYLEPLPWGAGELGVVLLVVAALGAGLLSGWQDWWLLLLLGAVAVGFVNLSGALWYGDPDYPDLNDILWLLLLTPILIAAGAYATTHLIGRAGRIAGGVVLALPLVVVVWAGYRHARPVDRRPGQPFRLEWGETKAYRDVTYGADKEQLISVLGRPDSTFRDEPGYEYLDYGEDEFTISDWGVTGFDIRDTRAETAQGVGIGDNLALVRERFVGADVYCRHNKRFVPKCGMILDGRAIEFEGDPIERIVIL
jgi:hypothetical protein